MRLFCLIFALIVSVQPHLNFRKDYVYLKEFGAFYKIHNQLATYDAAEIVCREEGAELIVAQTKEELEAVYSIDNNRFTTWMGVRRRYDGVFRTFEGLTESYCQYDGIKQTDKDCMIVNKDLACAPISCSASHRFVCKRTVSEPSRNNLFCDTYDDKYIYNEALDRCYKLHKKPLQWFDAAASCVKEDAHLLVIETNAEMIFIKNYLKDMILFQPSAGYAGQIFLGAHDFRKALNFETIHGESLNDLEFTLFSPGDPNNPGMERCLAFLQDGELNNDDCKRTFEYICEKKAKQKGRNVYVLKV